MSPQTYSVTVSFRGSGLDVEYGNLVSQDDGSFLETNISFHLEFIRKRKQAHEQHFA